MAKWNFEAAWAGLFAIGTAFLTGLMVLAIVGAALLLFGLTRRVGP